MQDPYDISSYHFHLPPAQIAQHPATERDRSRLMVLDLNAEVPAHRIFQDIRRYFRPGDLLITNNTRVFPARLFGRKRTGGRVELFLLHYPELELSAKGNGRQATGLALLRSSKRTKPGQEILIDGGLLQVTVIELLANGQAKVALHWRGYSLAEVLDRCGQVPLPPYISRPEGTTAEDRQRYQTTFAETVGSVAAPTAGLHFSDSLLADLEQMGVLRTSITLHVGYGTFAPVRCRDIREHAIHSELAEVTSRTAELVNDVKDDGGRIWAVGTTTVRTLEAAVDPAGRVQPICNACNLYIYPGFRFRVVDNLITNFHLPESSLLFLVSALAGRERILAAYQTAVAEGYRFFSYGDAMAILTRP